MAAGGMKSLAKDTAIYGLSSILGRLLNYVLVPIHIYVFTETSDYGIISRMQGLTALFFILLTYGMESGFFRFMNKEGENAQKVYSTSLISLGTTSLLFILFCFCFIDPISRWMDYTEHKEHIWMIAIIVAIDAFMAIPYAYLRYQKRPIRFVTIRLTYIFLNIFFNVLFLLILPWISRTYPDFALNKFYHPEIGIGYVFLAGLISTLITLLLIIPTTMKGLKFQFDSSLLKRMLKYSFPLLILGIAGVVSQVVAQLVYPIIIDDPKEAMSQLGIYTACIKFSVIIAMFVQAFRYAYEPFFFSQGKEKGNTKPYADAMKYFIVFVLLIFMAVMFYMDIITWFMDIIGKNYAVGLNVLPIAMLGEILFGIYFNLSIWYKLTDKTKYGAYFSVIGCIIQLAINIIFVPIYGYIASAWATLIANLIIVTLSYFIGQKYFPVKYDYKNIFIYILLTSVAYFVAMYPDIENDILRLGYRTLLLLFFTAFIIKKDVPLDKIPIVGKFINRKKNN